MSIITPETIAALIKEATENKHGFVYHPLTRPTDPVTKKNSKPGKIPITTGWQKLTETPKDIGKYLETGHNLGISCGKNSNVTILDLDSFLFIGDIFNGFELDTMRIKRTEERGHVYFKYNPNLKSSKHHDLGVEVLNDGENAVAAPSVHQSGEIYKSNNKPIIDMPKAVEDNLNRLFKTETEIKQIIAKCRHCFRDVIKRKPDVHNAEGREYMLAVCTDLKAKNANEDHIRMFAKLMYGKDSDEGRTLDEWRKIDPAKTWTCAKLKEKLPAFLDPEQCDKCEQRREKYKEFKEKKSDPDSNLVKFVEKDNVQLFHDDAGTAFVRIPIAGKHVVMQTGSKQFKQWLAHECYKETTNVPRSETLSAAINVIEGKCCFEGAGIKLNNRLCWQDGALWYDLGDWTAVRIRPEGWEIVPNPPILFRRYSHQTQHDAAKIKSGGDVNKIFKYLNIAGDEEKDLFLTTLLSYFIPDIPHAVIIPFGEQGSTKSTMFSLIKSIVDPSIIPLATFPKDNSELMQLLDHHYFIGFDNVSGLSSWQSDVMCRAASGIGFSKRKLFSNEDDVILKIKRCLGLNGINIVATKPDLLDRSVLIEVQRIGEDKRKPETEFWRDFEKDKGEILGAIFDVISKAMRLKVSLNKLPRMADFALWGSALSYASGKKAGSFIKAYYKNIERQNSEALDNSVVGELLTCFMETRNQWEGSASSLYQELLFLAENAGMIRTFPTSPNALTRKLNVLKTTLTKEGISYERKITNKETLLYFKTVEKTETINENCESGDIVFNITTISPPYHHLFNELLHNDGGESGESGDNSRILHTSILKKEGDNGGNEVREEVYKEVNIGILEDTKNTTTTTTITTPVTGDIIKSGDIDNKIRSNGETSVTEFKKAIEYNAKIWENSHGPINSVNVNEFITFFETHCKLSYGSNGNAKTFETSDIKFFINVMRKITPVTA